MKQEAIKTVTIAGANGIMGKQLAALFAAFGGIRVYMVCRDASKAKAAKEAAQKTIKCRELEDLLIPVTYESLAASIRDSDMIYESLSEDPEVKREFYQSINPFLTEEQLICTGTSSIQLDQLAEALEEPFRKNFAGMHFSNPPYRLDMCEIIPCEHTSRDTMERIRSFTAQVLFRTSVTVKDCPGFLVNAVTFRTLNEALRLSEQYGIAFVDALLGRYTGRSMEPLRTIDFLGLDTYISIVDICRGGETRAAWAADFIVPDFARKLAAQGCLGDKRQAGLYKIREKEKACYDPERDAYMPFCVSGIGPWKEQMIASLKQADYHKAAQVFLAASSEDAQLCLRFLLKYILFALDLSLLRGEDIHSADRLIASGFNWCPPISYISFFGGKENFFAIVKERLEAALTDTLDMERIYTQVSAPVYDFRRFFIAK